MGEGTFQYCQKCLLAPNSRVTETTQNSLDDTTGNVRRDVTEKHQQKYHGSPLTLEASRSTSGHVDIQVNKRHFFKAQRHLKQNRRPRELAEELKWKAACLSTVRPPVHSNAAKLTKLPRPRHKSMWLQPPEFC